MGQRTRCVIDGCPDTSRARGWCNVHYLRWNRTGDPLKNRREPKPEPDRFWPKVDAEGDCWLWIASCNRHGYGRFRRLDGITVLAHRWCYEYLVGPIPDGLDLDHLCRVPACVNPDHLEPVTHAENIRRGIVGKRQSARTACPSGHPYAGENLLIVRGSRRCRICERGHSRRSAKARQARLERSHDD